MRKCKICGSVSNKFISTSKKKKQPGLVIFHLKYKLRIHEINVTTKTYQKINKNPLPHSKPANNSDEIDMNHDMIMLWTETKDWNNIKLCDKEMLNSCH